VIALASTTLILTSVPTIVEVLHNHASDLGHNFIAYRNHAYRAVNLCAVIVKGRAELAKLAVATVFHDLGIWTNKTFDYIAPSIALAGEYLAAHGRAAWIAEIEGMIADHWCVRQAVAGILRFLRISYEAFEITSCWATVLASGAEHRAHDHPNNFLSGVYYLRTQIGANTINFHDPRSQTGIIRPPRRRAHGRKY
jgi:hypothetical protein